MNMPHPKPLLLIILDGFGISLEKEGNPVSHAKTPNFEELDNFFPLTALQASGVAVGLPWGEPGNSEVGHLTIGAGRIIYHHLPRIISSIRDGSFFKNSAFLKAAEHVRKNNSRLHIAGLISSGSVHSYIDHLYALLDFTKDEKVENVLIHIFSDGKDSPPTSEAEFLEKLEKRMISDWPQARFASVMGRFFAMDRDNKWDRTQIAYELLTKGKGEKITSVPNYIRYSYEKGITDEFIEPAMIQLSTPDRRPPTVQDGDALIFINFREDSMRQISHAFADERFGHFERQLPRNFLLVTMTQYEKSLNALYAYPALESEWPLARVISEKNLRQLHIAETQKYAHVTYFLNLGREKPFPNEDWILVPSQDVSRTEERPEMRAPEITQKILENMRSYDVIIANFANADMIGHSGDFEAAVRAVEILDESIGKLTKAVVESGAVMIITADHGNIELKRNLLTGEKLTKHSLNPVPFYLVGSSFRRKSARSRAEISALKKNVNGILTDVAPTLLELLEIKKPEEMTGKSLLDTLRREF
jgi:2,3-bisphosphoglycerate-independent phosphoglycerate mutase